MYIIVRNKNNNNNNYRRYDMENLFGILVIAVLVQLLLPGLIIEIGAFIVSIGDLFDGKERRRRKASKIFKKKFKDLSIVKLARMRDVHFGKHWKDENFERLSFSEFAVKYIDPVTQDYNETYRQEWGNV